MSRYLYLWDQTRDCCTNPTEKTQRRKTVFLTSLFSFPVPGRGPENVSSTEVNYTTFHITWAALPKEAAFGNITVYQVRLFSNTTCTMSGLITYVTLNTSTTEVLLCNLSLCTVYEVAVRAYTIVGPGPYSKPIVVQTLGEFFYVSTFSALPIQKFSISEIK